MSSISTLKLTQAYQRKRKIYSYLCSCGVIIVILGILSVILYKYNVFTPATQERFSADPSLNMPIIGSRISLPVKDFTSYNRNSSWNVVSSSANLSSWDEAESALRINYPAGSFGAVSSDPNEAGNGIVSGIHFSAKPEIFPTREACLSYDIKFSSDYDYVSGGKLPGMWIGDYGATGGNHISNGFSYRVMWRTKGAAEAYLYVPQQLSQYYSMSGYKSNGIKGESVWRDLPFSFNSGQWNSLKLYIKLNSFNKSVPNDDGYLHLSVNGGYRAYQSMVWATDASTSISGLLFQSFFGGITELM